MHNHMKTILQYVLSFLLLSCIAIESFASPAKVINFRIWESPEYTRVVLELSKPVKHQIMMLPKPERLVLDISNASKNVNLGGLDLNGTPIKSVRSAGRNKTDLRIVLD